MAPQLAGHRISFRSPAINPANRLINLQISLYTQVNLLLAPIPTHLHPKATLDSSTTSSNNPNAILRKVDTIREDTSQEVTKDRSHRTGSSHMGVSHLMEGSQSIREDIKVELRHRLRLDGGLRQDSTVDHLHLQGTDHLQVVGDKHGLKGARTRDHTPT